MAFSSIDQAVAMLRAGGLVAMPTETVYGLAADAENELAVRSIFAAKGRPENHPLIVHIASADALSLWASEVPATAWNLAAAFWPGPLTMILPRSPKAAHAVTGGLPTIGLRVPQHPVALELLRAMGGGVAAPSANRFGRVSPTTAAHVVEELGDKVSCVLDGGTCTIGVESTIVDLSNKVPCVLRPGAIDATQIAAVLGEPLGNSTENSTPCAGRLASHYAPQAGVELIAEKNLPARIAVCLQNGLKVAVLSDTAPLANVLHLHLPSSPNACAQRLYAALREADAQQVDVALVVPPPAIGVGVAVLDRLAKAAYREGK